MSAYSKGGEGGEEKARAGGATPQFPCPCGDLRGGLEEVGAECVPPCGLSPLPIWLNLRSLHHSRLPLLRKILEIQHDVRESAFSTRGPILGLAFPFKTCASDLPLAFSRGLPGGGGTFRPPV